MGHSIARCRIFHNYTYETALVAYYGIDAREKDLAIMSLIPVIASHAHHHFKVHVVFTWAKPKLSGRDGKRSTIEAVEKLSGIFDSRNSGCFLAKNQHLS